MSFFHRQDFGFGNPNMAGAFFAVLVLAVFLIPARGRWTRGLRFLISGVFFGCLLLTASRGALVGLGLGGFAAWAAAGFPRPKTGWLVLAIVIALSGFLGMTTIQRMSSLSPSEGSTASRIAIYRCVPAMVMAAPGGWGPGRAASAYENWFQGPGETTTFKNLLSTHATWIVERGILFFVCHAVLWLLALWFCNPAALGVLIAWGTCCAFSHVGGVWWMWVVPVLAVSLSVWAKFANHRGNGRLARLGWRAMLRQRPFVSTIQNRGRHGGHPSSSNSAAHGRDAHAPWDIVSRAIRDAPVSLGGLWRPSHSASVAFALALFTAFLLFFAAGVIGLPKPDVHYDGRIVRLGSGSPTVWFLAPDLSVVGKTYGKSLRSMGSVAVAERWEDVRNPSLLVLSGEPPSPPDLPTCDALVWLNPPAKISPELKCLVEKTPRKAIFWGALRSDANPRALRAWFETLPDARWGVVPGRGKFLGDVLNSVTKS